MRTRHKSGSGSNTTLLLIAIGLATLVAAVALHRGIPGPWLAKTVARPLPTIIKPGENWISTADIAVIDGDTISARGRVVRLVGFDTPETGNRARCQRERELGDQATTRLKSLVVNGSLDLRMVPCACAPGTEGTSACNFGRACGYLRVNGRDVGATLMAQGLAKPYVCSAYPCPPRQLWC